MDTTQLLKGVLDLAVLAVVRDEDGYGYDIVRRLRAAGIGDVGDASVYGTLRRLYSGGALSSYVVPSDGGPHRKYYAITAQGKHMLDEQIATWSHFAVAMSGLLAPHVPPSAAAPPGSAAAAGAAGPALFHPPAEPTGILSEGAQR
ncbi:Transcriptional regulator PadR-like family protein [Microbacterium azadirachtae]|uniref:Transcriptional regulator PadR-like family protein n=1 Tax=Microbacterium azadirachtae TaxID=582680 RepID=A0A0F0LRJ3_9MICO|nr:Transcriptional regulator PadR-like family protein [Microbacterium azadirachtae]